MGNHLAVDVADGYDGENRSHQISKLECGYLGYVTSHNHTDAYTYIP